MLPNNIEEITADHISSLVSERTTERRTLEYKERLPEGSDGAKKEFLADVCSFANALGGDLIFGIRDQRDANGRATGIPDSAVGLQLANAQAECVRLESMIRDGISPRVPATQVRTIEVDGVVVIIVRIGRSWIKPHMVTYSGSSRFYSRNSNGKYQLDVQEIGQAFAEQESLGDRLRSWRSERITKLVTGEGPVDLAGPRSLLAHFVPESSLVGRKPGLEWAVPEPKKLNLQPSSLSTSRSWRYNADGFVAYSVNIDAERKCPSYVQLFRNGCLEYGDGYILSVGYTDRAGVIPSAAFEKKLAEIFGNGLRWLDLTNVEAPVYFSCSLIGMRGTRLSRDSFWDIEAPLFFDRDVITTPEIEILNFREPRPYCDSLLPIVNSIWQANGYEHTPFLKGSDGRWDPFKY
jgi:hypothetical protein